MRHRSLIDSVEVVRDISGTTERHGERRHLTVLFCDLVSSAALAAQLDLRGMVGKSSPTTIVRRHKQLGASAVMSPSIRATA
jgi:hypothetical protein